MSIKIQITDGEYQPAFEWNVDTTEGAINTISIALQIKFGMVDHRATVFAQRSMEALTDNAEKFSLNEYIVATVLGESLVISWDGKQPGY